MSWKTILISKSDKISLKNGQLLVTTQEKQLSFAIEDINCVMLENNYTLITTQILSRLVANDVFIIVCDDKHNPSGIVLSLNQHWRPLEIFERQMQMTQDFKDHLRMLIIKQKISNYIVVLEQCNGSEKSLNTLKAFFNTVQMGDATNREGLASKVFFREIYGSAFIRHEDDGINNALNYGYKIIASAITRSLNKYGLNSYLGIFHRGKTNPFNLSYDFIEPFRPLIDWWVYMNNEMLVEKLSYNQRLELINVLNYEISLDNKLMTITTAINFMIKSFVTCLKLEMPTKLLLPTLLQQYWENE
ncbi:MULTISPECIES: type II CRISPR-associated endonuclease Cas1 [unclassified Spiroplasma]|uniref:type II CRISPR-associated endonuclease Cas1 n=1 Tax=unclassified Spiroplasma TaxID=2637901 RepID=UPI00313CAFF7